MSCRGRNDAHLREIRGRARISPLLLSLLLDTNDDEFGRLERGEPDDDDHLSPIDVILRHGIAERATHEVGVAGRLALERAGTEQAVHERPDVDPERGPQTVIVWLEYRPLNSVVDALLDHDRGAAHRDIAPRRFSIGR